MSNELRISERKVVEQTHLECCGIQKKRELSVGGWGTRPPDRRKTKDASGTDRVWVTHKICTLILPRGPRLQRPIMAAVGGVSAEKLRFRYIIAVGTSLERPRYRPRHAYSQPLEGSERARQLLPHPLENSDPSALTRSGGRYNVYCIYCILYLYVYIHVPILAPAGQTIEVQSTFTVKYSVNGAITAL